MGFDKNITPFYGQTDSWPLGQLGASKISKSPRQANDELQRQVEMMAVNAFRFDHIAASWP